MLYLKHFNFFSENSNPSCQLSTMAYANTHIIETIPTMEINTIHIDNEPSIHVKHFYDIQELKKFSLNRNETLLFCGARHFFNEPQTIYHELIRTFWRHVDFDNKQTIASKVLGVKVVLSYDTIAKAIGHLREGSTYEEGWEKNYDSHLTRALY